MRSAPQKHPRPTTDLLVSRSAPVPSMGCPARCGFRPARRVGLPRPGSACVGRDKAGLRGTVEEKHRPPWVAWGTFHAHGQQRSRPDLCSRRTCGCADTSRPGRAGDQSPEARSGGTRTGLAAAGHGCAQGRRRRPNGPDHRGVAGHRRRQRPPARGGGCHGPPRRSIRGRARAMSAGGSSQRAARRSPTRRTRGPGRSRSWSIGYGGARTGRRRRQQRRQVDPAVGRRVVRSLPRRHPHRERQLPRAGAAAARPAAGHAGASESGTSSVSER